MYKLIIEDDEGKTTVVPLIRDEITIGRKEGNTIRLTERNVSRRHARLVKSNGNVYIEDLESYNGIRVNGDRVAGRAPIREGDRIQIGDYQLALKADQAATSEGSPTEAQGEDRTLPYIRDPDTRKIDTAATEVDTVLPSGERPARLVVVSSNFARQEFPLERAAMVIGRTDDNDIIINHRSISRHHAKVVREEGRYQLVDLGSANGVRVNGDDYKKVELRRGDHVDLGHVRLRFVTPGEDFVFDRDAKIVEVSGGRSGLPFGAALLVGVLLVAGSVLVVSRLTKAPQPVAPAPSNTVATVARLSAEIDGALKVLDWDTAIQRAEKGLELDAGEERLREKKALAERERKNRATYEEYLAASKRGDVEEAVSLFQELGRDSVYQEKAKESYPAVQAAYLHEHLQKARALAAAGRCEEAAKHVDAMLFVDETNAEAQAVAGRCRAAAVAARPKAARRAEPEPAREEAPKRVVPRPPATAPVAEPAPEPATPTATPAVAAKAERPAASASEAGGDSEKLVNEAMDEYVHGNYAAATEKAKRANKSGTNSKAWRIIGASACFQKNRDEAKRAWDRLGQMDRQFIKYVCGRNQITIP